MAVTRRGENALALQLELIKGSEASERRWEFRWLAGASLLVALGLALVFFAKTQEFPGIRARLASGELLNLNAAHEPADWAAFAGTVGDTHYAAEDGQRLAAFLERTKPLANVGALNRLRVSRAELETDPRWSAWRTKASANGTGLAKNVPVTIPLFSLARIKQRLVVRTPEQFDGTFAGWILAYLLAFWIVHFAWRGLKSRGDGAILPALQLLTGIGLILMVSIRDPLRDTLEFRKFVWGAIGGCAILLLPLLKTFQTRNFARWVYTPLFVALALFVALLRFGSGPTGSDARETLGPFQPVEAIKILIVFFLAGYFAHHWNRLRDLHQKRGVPGWLRWLELPRVMHTLPVMYAVACALVMFFVLKDMGPALVTGMLFLTVFAVARRRVGLALLGLALLVGGVSLGYHFGAPHTVVERVSMWLSPWDNEVRGGDQLAHSLWALATGGPWGSGPGWGDPDVIPAGHTDLILPSIAEEWGFPGVASVCVLFAFLVARAFRIALRAPDEYAFFLATGLGTLIALEMLLISGGALGAIPLSGVVSPFLSSGNTAMLSNFLIFAVLLGISNQSARMAYSPGEEGAAARFDPIFGKPLRIAARVFGACALLLLGRAASVEIWHDKDLIAKDALVYTADGVKRPQHNPRLSLLAAMIPRGKIYDRNGVLLATSNWTEFQRHRSEYDALGVSVEKESPADTRHYPFGPATVHLLGDLRTGERFHATNASLVEHDSNRKLQGYRDYRELAAVVRYRHQLDNPQLGALLKRDRDVRTTIDIRLQLKLAAIMRAHLKRDSDKGAAVVMNAETGDLLAMVSWPQPADNTPTSDELLDRARYGEYPPGSTFKLVTAAAALRLDPQAARRTFSCRRLSDGRAGTVIAGWRRPIRDDVGDHVHGTLNMTHAITVSCNAYFAQLGVSAVGSKALRETAARFGIDAGSEAQVKQMLPFAAYGQGSVVATPLKMARVAATIAADGSMPEGRWVFDGSDGRTQAPTELLSAESAATLANAMRSVVTSGTARTAMTGLGIQVAGKTGTAQLDRGQPHSWFAGFAPYDALKGERVSFAVIAEHGGYGAKTAAPIARELVEAAVGLGIIGKPVQK